MLMRAGAHEGHGHGLHPGAGGEDERRLRLALLLTGGFMFVEVIGGILAGSLALLADAAHMLTDAGALALGWAAVRIGRRPADARRSYGYRRFEVLAAFVNGFVLLLLCLWIAVEAVRRLLAPVEVLSGAMLVVAVLGLIVNAGSLAILRHGGHDSLNVRAAALHVAGDLAGSVAAIAAALVIAATGWMAIDPLLSLLVGGLVAWSGWGMMRRTTHVLLEGTPASIDVEALRETLLREVPELQGVHHVHAWSLTAQEPLLTLHATIRPDVRPGDALRRVKHCLAAAGIAHSVVQIEPGACPDGGNGEACW